LMRLGVFLGTMVYLCGTFWFLVLRKTDILGLLANLAYVERYKRQHTENQRGLFEHSCDYILARTFLLSDKKCRTHFVRRRFLSVVISFLICASSRRLYYKLLVNINQPIRLSSSRAVGHIGQQLDAILNGQLQHIQPPPT